MNISKHRIPCQTNVGYKTHQRILAKITPSFSYTADMYFDTRKETLNEDHGLLELDLNIQCMSSVATFTNMV